MRRLVEFLEMELEIFCAVISHRIRSVVLFSAAIVAPPLIEVAVLRIGANLPIPVSGHGMHTAVALFGLVVTLKLLFLAVQTYLKDRAMLLRF